MSTPDLQSGVTRDIYGMPAFVTLAVTDVRATADWFARATDFIELFAMPPGDDPDLIHLRRWRYQDILVRRAEPPETAVSAAVQLSFAAEFTELDVLATRARATGATVEGPTDTPWNTRDLAIVSPSGLRVVFTARRPAELQDQAFSADMQRWSAEQLGADSDQTLAPVNSDQAVDATDAVDPDAFAARVVDGAIGWMQTMSIHVGLELGWYQALHERALTAPELAAATTTSARYAREWLEQQCAYDILAVDDPGAAPDQRRFSLSAERATVLLDGSSLAFAGPIATMLAASAARMPEILDAYRTGGGVSWERLGELARTAQADINRPWFDTLPAELARIAGIGEVLARPGARVADVGTGGGWSALALARAYPHLEVVGIDIDEPSIEMARRNAADAGLEGRVRFVHDDAANLAEHGAFDLAIALECVHDMPYPATVLAAMRQAVGPDGAVLVLDEAVNERFTPAADQLEQLMYGYSLFVCLPDGMSHPRSAGTGTVMRPSTLTEYAQDAGFTGVDVVLDQFGFWRLYRLR